MVLISTSTELYRWSNSCVFYFKASLRYNMVCHASLFVHVVGYATCSSSARVYLREIDSVCSAVITAHAAVHWQSILCAEGISLQSSDVIEFILNHALSGHSQAEVETLSRTSPASSTTCDTSHPLEHIDLPGQQLYLLSDNSRQDRYMSNTHAYSKIIARPLTYQPSA